MTNPIYYLGIRHHGTGSAKRLLSALATLRPCKVLIEMPSDTSDALPLLADPAMKPPVALLAYNGERPAEHFYYPFSEFSPEYQAVQWAVANNAEIVAIDLPVAVKFAHLQQKAEQQALLKEQLEKELAEKGELNNDDLNNDELNHLDNSNNELANKIFDNDNLETDHLENSHLENDNLENNLKNHSENNTAKTPDFTLKLKHDPIGVLASLAGYQDGESWWNDYLEMGNDNDPLAVFSAVGQAMSALRNAQDELQNRFSVRPEPVEGAENGGGSASSPRTVFDLDDDDFETLAREACMRELIAKHDKELTALVKSDDVPNGLNPVMVVVCGAWHIPALDPALTPSAGKTDKKADTALLKSLPKKLPTSRLKITWIPYTTPRLAKKVGYGAGVSAPMWYQHLWDCYVLEQSVLEQTAQANDFKGDFNTAPPLIESWLGKIAQLLRQGGHIVSTASLIEAVRLAKMLALVKNRPSVGFEELTDSVIACLCFGESVAWQGIADLVLLGNRVGEVPPNLPLAPLLEDLQKWQKSCKLPAEADEKEIALDLRSEIGLKKSHLLNRLAILGVDWGVPLDKGNSRGTFRERWRICWHPEFAVALVENLLYGNTILMASDNRLAETLGKTDRLSELIAGIQTALEADLGGASRVGLSRLQVLATHTDTVNELLSALPPLIALERYGTARTLSLDKVGELVGELVVKTCVALPYAICHISDDEARALHTLTLNVHNALLLAELDDELMSLWWQTLGTLASADPKGLTHKMLHGLAVRLLYQADKLDEQTLGLRFGLNFSPAVDIWHSTAFFEGFFMGIAQNLLYDSALLTGVKNWLMSLETDAFTHHLPLFRRVFGELDSIERKRLLDQALNSQKASKGVVADETMSEIWAEHLVKMGRLLNQEKGWWQS